MRLDWKSHMWHSLIFWLLACLLTLQNLLRPVQQPAVAPQPSRLRLHQPVQHCSKHKEIHLLLLKSNLSGNVEPVSPNPADLAVAELTPSRRRCSRCSSIACGARIRSLSGSQEPRRLARAASAAEVDICHSSGAGWTGDDQGTRSPSHTTETEGQGLFFLYCAKIFIVFCIYRWYEEHEKQEQWFCST